MHTYWVTFYSYKGGVGRSMALANVAAALAAKGRRVVMIDFDLEAPGLDAFEELGVTNGQPGVVEYVSRYIETDVAPPVSSYIQEVGDNKSRPGRLWLMSAGRKDEEYNRQRAKIDWEEFYDLRDGAIFFENLKADIHQQFQPDYVFVDSRTGLTDVGGVCTLHLPDMVVLLFSLNEQNLIGISSVARVLRNAETPPLLLPVATPVPNLPRDKDGLVKERFDRAKELLGISINHTLSYSSVVSLKEQIVAWAKPNRLYFEYRDLANAIANTDPMGLDYLLREAESALENLELDRAREICSALESEYTNRPEAWIQIAEEKRLNRDLEGFEAALRKALKLDPNRAHAFNKLEALMVGQKRERDLLDLSEEILAQDGALEAQTKKIIHSTIGQISMHLGDYENAAVAMERLISLRGDGDEKPDPESELVSMFNLCESRRRAGKTVPFEDWVKIVTLYESFSTGSGTQPAATQLNWMQAMHIAYAMAGKIEKVKEILQDVRRLAENISPRERIFSVATYRNVPREEFLIFNDQMIESLENGKLWDGFELS